MGASRQSAASAPREARPHGSLGGRGVKVIAAFDVAEVERTSDENPPAGVLQEVEDPGLLFHPGSAPGDALRTSVA